MTLKVRRVIAGATQGRSKIVADGPPPTVIEIDPSTGMGGALLWSTGKAPRTGIDADDATASNPGFHPPPGETRFILFCMAPGAVAEMHATDSIDHFVMIEGEIELHVNQGTPTTIRAGDMVVCLGANHKWANTSDKIAKGVLTAIGAERSA